MPQHSSPTLWPPLIVAAAFVALRHLYTLLPIPGSHEYVELADSVGFALADATVAVAVYLALDRRWHWSWRLPLALMMLVSGVTWQIVVAITDRFVNEFLMCAIYVLLPWMLAGTSEILTTIRLLISPAARTQVSPPVRQNLQFSLQSVGLWIATIGISTGTCLLFQREFEAGLRFHSPTWRQPTTDELLIACCAMSIWSLGFAVTGRWAARAPTRWSAVARVWGAQLALLAVELLFGWIVAHAYLQAHARLPVVATSTGLAPACLYEFDAGEAGVLALQFIFRAIPLSLAAAILYGERSQKST